MRRIVLGIAAAVALLLGVFSYPRETVNAQVVIPIDTSAFSNSTSLSFMGQMSNDTYNCGWAMDCSYGRNSIVPQYHNKTAEQLKRTSGWFIAGTDYTSSDLSTEVDFYLVASFFSPGLNSQGKTRSYAAAKDFATGIQNNVGLERSKKAVSVSPSVTYKFDGALEIPNTQATVRAVAFSTKDFEVEILVIYDHSRKTDSEEASNTLASLAASISAETAAQLSP